MINSVSKLDHYYFGGARRNRTAQECSKVASECPEVASELVQGILEFFDLIF